jgi:heme O synthase-like polyprenyltransferase
MFPVLVRQQNFVGFEVLTAVVMKSTVFWDITVYTVFYPRSTLQQNFDYRS